MRTMSLRALYREPPALIAQVTLDGEVVGTFVPVAMASPESIEWALVGSPPVARMERISVITALEEVGVDLDGVQPHIRGTDYYDGRDGDIEAEPVVRKRKVLGEVTPAGPVAKHGSQDELDAARKARSEALNEARRKAQEQRDGWLKKMGKGAT